MVCLDLYENNFKDQLLRTLTALSIIVTGDIIYSRLSTGSFDRLKNNKLAYFNVWITLAIVFGVSILHHNENDIIEVNNNTIKDHAYYGILIGLLVYVPLLNWLLSCGEINNMMSLSNTCFGIILSTIACLWTFLISVKTNLFD